MRAADYDTSCTTAADCAPVSEDGVCACQGAGCSNAAVNKKDLAKYAADYAARRKLCTAEQDSCALGACDTVRATCIAGRCGVCSTSSGCAAADAGADASNDAAASDAASDVRDGATD